MGRYMGIVEGPSCAQPAPTPAKGPAMEGGMMLQEAAPDLVNWVIRKAY